MVIDFLLDLLFGILHFLVGLLPDVDVVPEGLRLAVWGWQVGEVFIFINHYFPLRELFTYVPSILLILLVLAGVRFVLAMVRGG